MAWRALERLGMPVPPLAISLARTGRHR